MTNVVYRKYINEYINIIDDQLQISNCLSFLPLTKVHLKYPLDSQK